MKETHALFAGEMSGHLFFADRYFGFDDAIYAGARLLEILTTEEKSIRDLLPASRQWSIHLKSAWTALMIKSSVWLKSWLRS
jgi:phosphomannomutase